MTADWYPDEYVGLKCETYQDCGGTKRHLRTRDSKMETASTQGCIELGTKWTGAPFVMDENRAYCGPVEKNA
jgi:hypothetical protein